MTIPEQRLSAFGEYRVVEPKMLFDDSSAFGRDLDVWGFETVGGGLVADVLAQSAFRLSVGTGGTDAVRGRTHERFRYQSGRGQRVRLTGYVGEVGLVGRTYRWGLYDDNDGVGFEVVDGVLYLFKRQSTGVGATPVRVAQSAWNLDPMDGSGPSGKSLDYTKGHIYEVRFAWLGVGPLTFFVDGHPVHTFAHGDDSLAVGSAGGGSAQAPWMKRANLPISCEVVNSTSLGAGGSLTMICRSVASDGGDNDHGLAFAYASPADVQVDASPVERALFALRIGATFKGISDHGVQAIPSMLSASGEGGRAAVRLIWNPTLVAVGSPAWVAADPESAVEVWLNGALETTNPRIDSFTGGRTLFRAVLGGDTNASLQAVDLSPIFHQLGRKLRRRAYGVASDLAPGATDILLVTLERLSGTVQGRACVAWEESR